MSLMICNPGSATAERFTKVNLKGGSEDSAIRRKNLRTERIEITQSDHSLTFKLSFSSSVIGGVTLLISKMPERPD